MAANTISGMTPFLAEHKRRPTIKLDGIEVWLQEQIDYLETISRTEFGDGSLAAYKHVLAELKLMNNQLLPCPFCGAPGVIVHIDDSDYRYHWYWEVQCSNRNDRTDGSGYSECWVSGPNRLTEQEAVEAWNKRNGQ